MVKILVVDDDKEIADLLEFYLHNEGYDVSKAFDGKQAQQVMEQESFDLLILDVMMPEIDGLTICREMRQMNDIPILMVSAKVEAMDKIIGLTTGADDYMEKPFHPLELIARVKALLRRSNMKNQAVGTEIKDNLTIQSLTINKHQHTVTVDGNLLSLTPIEFDILYLMAANPGRVYSSEEIFEYVWNEQSYGVSKTVMIHISNLRKKLDGAAKGEKIIQTVWGVGYKIDC